MKTYKTIEAYKQAWLILREMNLEWIFSGVKPDSIELPLTRIIDQMLANNRLVELMKAITRSNHYVPSGSKFGVLNQLKRTRWGKTEIEKIVPVVTDFFVGMLPMFSVLGMLGEIKAAAPVNPSPTASSSEPITS